VKSATMFSKVRKTALYLALMALPMQTVAANGQGDAIVGVWEVEDATGRIEILPCGDKYCGRIVWIKEPLYPSDDPGGMGGRPLLDRENPKKELRRRPQMGLRIMEGYTYRSDNFWDSGVIYDTENGNTYKSRLKLKSPDRLELRAFIGISLLGGTTEWKRMPAR
jgi:uncharacterized protein (DUF2147 family)